MVNTFTFKALTSVTRGRYLFITFKINELLIKIHFQSESIWIKEMHVYLLHNQRFMTE